MRRPRAIASARHDGPPGDLPPDTHGEEKQVRCPQQRGEDDGVLHVKDEEEHGNDCQREAEAGQTLSSAGEKDDGDDHRNGTHIHGGIVAHAPHTQKGETAG
jgi:hypothetical protein